MGRPSEATHWLTEEGLITLGGWALDGLTDKDIAYNMGINVSTLYEYKKKYKEIHDTLKRTKEVADRRVENALYKRACGFKYDEVTKEGNKIVKVVTKTVSPDTTAQIFWLKNRMTHKYRDVKPIELTGAEGKDLSISVTIDDVDKDKE